MGSDDSVQSAPSLPFELKYTLQDDKYHRLMAGAIETVQAEIFMDYEMYPTLNSLKSNDPNSKSKYVMMACLMRGKLGQQIYGKWCY